MELEQSTEIECPHCGEWSTTFVDLSQGSTQYIEDCQVCCKPITITVTVHDLESSDFEVTTDAAD